VQDLAENHNLFNKIKGLKSWHAGCLCCFAKSAQQEVNMNTITNSPSNAIQFDIAAIVLMVGLAAGMALKLIA
jgi:hypothetical protein